jgi:hypothetical protein
LKSINTETNYYDNSNSKSKIEKENNASSNPINISKLLTLENTPNKFLSNFYLDRFFIINGDSIKLFDNNFLIVNNKNFNLNKSVVNYNSSLSYLETFKLRNNNTSIFSDINKNNFNNLFHHPQSIFANIGNYTLINNQISFFKTSIDHSLNSSSANSSSKNLNSFNTKNKHSNNPDLNSNNYNINNINNSTSKIKIYEKGSFIENPNIIMLSNKEIISLCDFRVYKYL